MSDYLAVYQAAELLLGCVCSEMNLAVERDVEDYPGCPCHTYVSLGTPAFDVCCDPCDDGDARGQATVHWEDVFATETFPTRVNLVHPCRPASYAAAMVVTVARCAPAMGSDGSAPSAAALDRSPRAGALDQVAALTALTCCLPDIPVPGKRRRRVTLTGVRNVPPSECVGIEIRATVEVGIVCPCPEEGS